MFRSSVVGLLSLFLYASLANSATAENKCDAGVWVTPAQNGIPSRAANLDSAHVKPVYGAAKNYAISKLRDASIYKLQASELQL